MVSRHRADENPQGFPEHRKGAKAMGVAGCFKPNGGAANSNCGAASCFGAPGEHFGA